MMGAANSDTLPQPEQLQALAIGDSLASATVPSGSSSAVERQLPKLDVAGSIPVSRSNPDHAVFLKEAHAMTSSSFRLDSM
jgi:hypothetical protein